ncbi:MAG TPA: VCBS repeat-containing protein [Sandaracinaceae bacterium LLY-WYZ-13_1]|nr:VCBS repeat-containing protein [Sandaracinaceae bacterium LLY-WYZ-13_1]
MRGRARWLVVLGLVAPWVDGCGSERAATVELSPEVSGDALCVWAYGDGERVFARSYDREEGALPAGSLTFVAGERVSEDVVVAARVLRGGAVVAEGAARIAFGDGLVSVDLPVARCQPADAPPVGGTRGVFAEPPARMEAADVDGDGLDELVAWTGGALHVLTPAGPSATSRVAVTGPDGLRVSAAADFDRDCGLELVAVGDDQVRLVSAPEGDAALGEPAAAGARDAHPGAPTRAASLVLAGATGLTLVPRGGEATRTVDGSFEALGVGDLDGDGIDDVVASGAGGTRAFLGGDALTERPDALPPRVAAAAGPLRLADLDGDGALDLAVADGSGVRVAVNRGDGLLEERGGDAPPTLATAIGALRAGDVDGDCRDELVALAADGSARVLRLTGDGLADVPGEWPTARDAAVATVAEGRRALVWLTPEGEVVEVAP